ncbi:hypothetical protein Pla144_44890 [Bythopirellula polymerisocia]|uniref:Glycoside hydrolase family 42 N-terminal domain-containing protein n=1 Tax=Bythopirellula polymerisocia TaxID=2528003 RepID=A0A5C6CAP8_9BACT|nr:hypothetical protein Pla144_44890 [Bythopirellula polymerisocia]
MLLEGFDTEQYSVGSQLDGSAPTVSGFDGIWAGSGSASIESGSLHYAGLGVAGTNHVQLNDSITISRQFSVGSGDPLENFVDTNGDIGISANSDPLYLSVLMQVDGTAPPTSTFSLFNNGTSSANREFRILYSQTNTSFQAIAGPSGTAANLDPLNNAINLFVFKFEFSTGNDIISVWQNPTAGAPESTPDAQFTTFDIAFDRLAFTRFIGTGTAKFDEVRLGTEWSAVTDETALDLVPKAPITTDGFNNVEYLAGGLIDDVWSYIPGFDGAWATTAASATTEAGSLNYAGFGTAGANRLQLNGTEVVSRLILDGNNGPLANYLDTSGDIATSSDSSELYFSFLMKVDGSSPPTSTFSLYNDGVSSEDRVFRILYSASNSAFQVITGPAGTAINLDPLNNGTNLFVVKVDFASGNDTISVWQNPVVGDLEVTPDAVITDHDLAFDRIAFSRFSGVGTTQFDEFRLGSTWSAATSAAALNLLSGPQAIVGLQGLPPSPLGGSLYPQGFFPFIDEFGQYRYLNWTDKINSLDELIQSVSTEAADLTANPGPADFDLFGGWSAGPQLTATGFFYTAKVNDKWWLVDPEGRLFFSNGITGVSDPDRFESTEVAVKTGVTDREEYFAYLPDAADPAEEFLQLETSTVTSGNYQGSRPLTMNFFAANALKKYGTDWEAQSQQIAHERLRSWGMNTIAGWSDEDVYLQQRTPYTMVLFPQNPSLINSNSKFADYFDPNYLVNVKNRINEEAGKSLNDPWTIGYFIHNELNWTRGTLTDDTEVGLEALAAVSTQPAKIAFRDQMQSKYGTIQNLNAQWQTSYASWNSFLTLRNVTPNLGGANADLVAFDVSYAEQYFSSTKQAMQEAAPNHLYLGARFTGSVRLAPAQAAMAYADVVSINRYGPDISVLPPGLVGDVPLISGEYHFSANDTGLWSDGLKTATDQADRAEKFTTYLESALNSDRYVGVHWLQYWDFPSSGKLNSNNNNSNLGFVSITDTPYSEIVDAARSVGASLYETRVGDFGIIVDRTLYLNGTESADQFTLSAGVSQLSVTRNSITQPYTLSEFDTVVVSGGYDADSLSVSGLIGKTLIVRNADSSDTIEILDGQLILTVETDAMGPSVSICSAAAIQLTAGARLSDLDVQGQVSIESTQNSPDVVTVSVLTLGPFGMLDLGNNGLIIDYTLTSPLTAIGLAVSSAYQSGNWNGAGITSSYGDAFQSAVGYGESAVLLPPGGMFLGTAVDSTSILIRHTLYGDANLNGAVDASDFNIWNQNRISGGNWSAGDFNYDGAVDSNDFDLWLGNIFTDVSNIAPPILSLQVETVISPIPIIPPTDTVGLMPDSSQTTVSDVAKSVTVSFPLVLPDRMSLAGRLKTHSTRADETAVIDQVFADLAFESTQLFEQGHKEFDELGELRRNRFIPSSKRTSLTQSSNEQSPKLDDLQWSPNSMALEVEWARAYMSR